MDFERALIADRKLRVLSKENPDYKPVRKKIRELIEAWEIKHWSADLEITDVRINESDLSSFIAENERRFVEKRKNLIKAKLKSLNLSQQGLGILSGHNIELFSNGMAMQMNDFCKLTIFRGSRKQKLSSANQDKGFQSEFTAFFEAIKTGKPVQVSYLCNISYLCSKVNYELRSYKYHYQHFA